MIDIRFTDEMNPRNASRVIDQLRGPRDMIPNQDYGNKHEEWLERIEPRLIRGDVHALFGEFGRVAAGAIVFRPEPSDSNIAGIRCISIPPEFKGRRIASFMLRNTELLIEEMYPRTEEVIVDTKTTNHNMIAFLESQGYRPEEITDLYQSGKPDIVFSKTLRARDEASDLQPYVDRSTH